MALTNGTHGMLTHTIMTISIAIEIQDKAMPFSITTFGIMTLQNGHNNCKTKPIDIQHNDTQHNDTQNNVIQHSHKNATHSMTTLSLTTISITIKIQPHKA
jgi:hypothetical protein